MTRLAVFDCDGTLIDSQASICRAMAIAFERVGLASPTPAAVRRQVGLSLPLVIAALLPDADDELHEAVVAGYRRAFQGLRAQDLIAEPLYDGIDKALAMLADRGWLLGVATGKSDRGLALALARHGLGDRFVTLQTADRHPSKPDPAMLIAAMNDAGSTAETTVMVGDSTYDVLMARAIGVTSIGVDWGYHDKAALLAAGASRVLDHPSEIVEAMEAI